MGFGRQSWRSFALAVVLLVVRSAAGIAGDVPSPHAGGTLNFGISTDAAIIDPSITGSSITALIARNVVDSLVGQAEDNRFTPWLAERWEISGDNTRYTFHLRQGVTFSDGTPLDAAAVKYNSIAFSIRRRRPATRGRLLGPVDSVGAPDERTLVVSYRQPFAPLLQGLSLPYLGIHHRLPIWEKRRARPTLSVGSGPFRVGRLHQGQRQPAEQAGRL